MMGWVYLARYTSAPTSSSLAWSRMTQKMQKLATSLLHIINCTYFYSIHLPKIKSNPYSSNVKIKLFHVNIGFLCFGTILYCFLGINPTETYFWVGTSGIVPLNLFFLWLLFISFKTANIILSSNDMSLHSQARNAFSGIIQVCLAVISWLNYSAHCQNSHSWNHSDFSAYKL